MTEFTRHGKAHKVLKLLKGGPLTQAQVLAALGLAPRDRDYRKYGFVFATLRREGLIDKDDRGVCNLRAEGANELAALEAAPTVRVFARAEDCREAEVALNEEVLGFQYGDGWGALRDIDDEDRPWLIEAFPAVAARMGFAPTGEKEAGR